MDKKNPLISFIMQEGILDEKTLEAVFEKHEKTGQGLINILKKEKLLDEEQLAKAIAGTSQTEFINLSPDMIEPMVAHLVPYEVADQHNVIPITRDGDRLKVAMSSPSNLAVRDQIEMKTGYKVIPVAATPSAIKRAINYHFDVANITKQAIVSMRMEEESTDSEKHDELEHEHIKTDSSPIAKLVSSIVDGAIDARASDIHIEPQDTEVRVRYRIDGALRPTLNVPLSVQQEMVSHIKIMADMDISERRVPQDGHITTSRSGQDYDLRVSSLPAIGGEKIVIRVLDKSVDKWSIDDVVTSAEDNKKFRSLVDNPYGMLLLTGPTGSGKTTTLYSMLQLLNTPEKNIVTVEDPVEYRLAGITQVQTSKAAGRTFALALRSILRQDPDVILIGEIRDAETAEIAVSSALTGHLVLSTLHTNDAAGAISRLFDLDIPPFLAASALLGTAAQRLVRTCCPKCRQSYKPSEQELERLFGDKAEYDKNIELYRSKGCESCHKTGYHGRKSIYEILPISPQIRRMIMDEKSDQDIKQKAIEEGMKILRQKAVDDVLAGITTTEEMMRIVDVKVV